MTKKDKIELIVAEEMTPLEEVITNELAKHNITEAILAEMEANFLPLTINGLDDKEGYVAVDNARKAVKNLRVMGVKICKDNRAEAIKFQKKWIEAEDKFEARTKAIETALEEKQAVIDTEKDRIKAEKETKEQAILQERSVKLTQLGCTFTGDAYTIENIRISTIQVKTADNFTWQALFAAVETKFKEKEAVRLEEERLREESVATAKLLAEENLRKQEELNKKQADLDAQQKAIEEEKLRQKIAAEKLIQDQQNSEKLRIELEQAAIKKAKDARLKERMSSLFAIGFSQQGESLLFKDMLLQLNVLDAIEDSEWPTKLKNLEGIVGHMKVKIEQERLDEIERVKQVAIESEHKRLEKIVIEEKAEEDKRIAEENRIAALAPDITKLNDFLKMIANIPVPEFTTVPYQEFGKSIDSMRKQFLTHLYSKKPV